MGLRYYSSMSWYKISLVIYRKTNNIVVSIFYYYIMPQKTAIIYRPLFDLEVKQEIDSMLYNATDIVKWYNLKTGGQKDVFNFMRQQATQDYIEFLKKVEPLKIGFKSVRGKYAGTRLCEELVIDLMMWLSVEFKHQAITFILSGKALSVWRHNIKEWYKRMCLAIADSWSANYRDEATMLNVLVSWSPASNQRARYWEDKQQLMDDMQKANATMIRLWMPIWERKNALIKEFIN